MEIVLLRLSGSYILSNLSFFFSKKKIQNQVYDNFVDLFWYAMLQPLNISP